MSNRTKNAVNCGLPVSTLEAYPDGNPKTQAARSKPSFHAVPASALLHLGAAMADGKRKYGLTNWRSNNVAASVYYDAMIRHLLEWWDAKQQNADDSQVHHLGHVMACCAIILDAEASGNLIDDRPAISGPYIKVAKAIAERGSAK